MAEFNFWNNLPISYYILSIFFCKQAGSKYFYIWFQEKIYNSASTWSPYANHSSWFDHNLAMHFKRDNSTATNSHTFHFLIYNDLDFNTVVWIAKSSAKKKKKENHKIPTEYNEAQDKSLSELCVFLT